MLAAYSGLRPGERPPHNDYLMLVEVYACWIDSASHRELDRIWENMKNRDQNAPIAPKLAS